MFKKIAIVGVGLIGGSIGLAARKRRLAKEVIGVARRESSRKKALKYKACDRATLNLKEGVRDADLVIIAVPVGKIISCAVESAKYMKDGALITDVGSTKKYIVENLEKTLPERVNFVGSHPMAGSEKGGPRNAAKDLFKSRDCFVTKTKNTDSQALNKVKGFWRRLGANPIEVSLKEHDRVVAKISQMVHIAASSLAIAGKDALKYAASGFRDTTRIAMADPSLWKDICMTNSSDIAKSLDELIAILKNFRKAISQKNTRKIQTMLEEASKCRKRT